MAIIDHVAYLTREIGECARCAPHSVVPAAGETTSIDLGTQACRTVGVGPGMAIEADRVEMGIQHPRALKGCCSRGGDTTSNHRRAFTIAATEQVIGVGPLHRDPQIEPIKQGPRESLGVSTARTFIADAGSRP